MLPKEKTEIIKNPYEYKWLIYGQPKIGKSTYVSQFDNPLFLATEDRFKGLSVYKIPEIGAINSWQQFCLIVKEIKENIDKNNFKWDTIVIDTVDNLIQLCIDYVCIKQNMQHPSDKEYGKGYAFVYTEFFRVINNLSNLGKGLVFITHSEEKTIKTRNIEMTKIIPSISGKVGKAILAMVDIIGYIGLDINDAKKRVVYFRGNECLEAGDTTGNLDPVMDYDYQKIKEKFNSDKNQNPIREDVQEEIKKKEKVQEKIEKKDEPEDDFENGINKNIPEKEIEPVDFQFNEKGEPELILFETKKELIEKCENLEDLRLVWESIMLDIEALKQANIVSRLITIKDQKKESLIKKGV